MTETTILETERLRLKEWKDADSEHLKSFLQDPQVMYAYEGAFSDEEVQQWLQTIKLSYEKTGYGLWALVLKDTGEIIGECGLMNQVVAGEEYVEIGYHLKRSFWHQGYAIEAAQAVKDYAFKTLKCTEVISLIRDTNIASMNVAIRNQMLVKKRFTKQYKNSDMPHYIFSVKND